MAADFKKKVSKIFRNLFFKNTILGKNEVLPKKTDIESLIIKLNELKISLHMLLMGIIIGLMGSGMFALADRLYFDIMPKNVLFWVFWIMLSIFVGTIIAIFLLFNQINSRKNFLKYADRTAKEYLISNKEELIKKCLEANPKFRESYNKSKSKEFEMTIKENPVVSLKAKTQKISGGTKMVKKINKKSKNVRRFVGAIKLSTLLLVSYWGNDLYEKAFATRNVLWVVVAFLLIVGVLMLVGKGFLDAIQND